MITLGLPEFLILAAAVVLVIFGKNLPEYLQSLVLSKKQFNERKSQVSRRMDVIDYAGELSEQKKS